MIGTNVGYLKVYGDEVFVERALKTRNLNIKGTSREIKKKERK